MTQDVWNAVDGYVAGRIVGEDEAMAAASRAGDAAGLPHIAVAPAHGKLLHILALSIGARRVLEIGTLAGYSTIWLARALPEEGRMVSLEYDRRHAEVARANLKHAGLGGKVEVIVGAALDTLPSLEAEEPFDLFFIDADKENNADYFRWAVKLSHPGSLIYVDNVVRGGRVADPGETGAMVEGTRRLYEAVGAEPGVTATAVQTVSVQGYDGFLLARVN
ncbi:MAG TPA: O-methyltransferase [Candidatus Limnocylindrales bacterium]|nr:O-methyltransferase [Candidatus Limnocylindrales bacterium]